MPRDEDKILKDLGKQIKHLEGLDDTPPQMFMEAYMQAIVEMLAQIVRAIDNFSYAVRFK